MIWIREGVARQPPLAHGPRESVAEGTKLVVDTAMAGAAPGGGGGGDAVPVVGVGILGDDDGGGVTLTPPFNRALQRASLLVERAVSARAPVDEASKKTRKEIEDARKQFLESYMKQLP